MIKNTPSIRFKEFEDVWYKHTFGYYFDERNERTGNGELISVTINSGIRKFSDINRNDTKPGDLSKYKKVEVGDIAYNSMRMWQGASGYSPYTGVLSPAYTVIIPRENVSSMFFSYQIKRSDMIHKFEINSQGMTKDTWNLKFPAFSKIETFAPQDICEQEKIAEMLSMIDNIISSYECKYDKLLSIKESLLDNMFPKNNENVPRIRFTGFSKSWELRKLEDYLKVSEEKNANGLYTKDDVLSVSGDVGVVNQIEYQGRSFAGASVCNYGVVHEGDVVYTKSPLKNNPYGIIKTNKGKTGIVSVLYGIYKPKNNCYPNFVQNYFEQDARINNYLRTLVNKGAKNTLLISDQDALNGFVYFAPSYAEQKSISLFFDKLNYIIELYQNAIVKFENIKSALLDKMFV